MSQFQRNLLEDYIPQSTAGRPRVGWEDGGKRTQSQLRNGLDLREEPVIAGKPTRLARDDDGDDGDIRSHGDLECRTAEGMKSRFR